VSRTGTSLVCAMVLPLRARSRFDLAIELLEGGHLARTTGHTGSPLFST
jgi:hypothetical protein